MPISSPILDKVLQEAKSVLRSNDLGRSTKPAPDLYPHQWNWDSAFIAIGLSQDDTEKAQLEIMTLLEGQWQNGMIPHMIFNPDAASYYPGPEFWGTAACPDASTGPQTSGITQPNLIALAALTIYHNSDNNRQAKRFLNSIYERTLNSLLFLRNNRVVDDTGLACIIHPWESGLDNSPAWDPPLEHVTPVPAEQVSRWDTDQVSADERPTDLDYRRYMALVQIFKDSNYSQSHLMKNCPFLVHSVLFNSILYQDLEAMIEIQNILGYQNAEIQIWRDQIKSNFDRRFLNTETGLYQDYDCRTNRAIEKDTFSTIIPLITDIPSPDTIERIIERLTSTQHGWSDGQFAVSTVSHESSDYNPIRYWRGPIWINVNWLLINGLSRHGYANHANQLEEISIRLVIDNGFYEYFDAESGEGHGANSFSWTAALLIDIIGRYKLTHKIVS